MSSLLEKLFERNQELINKNTESISKVSEKSNVSGFTYSFIQSTYAEAVASNPSNYTIRFITNARKSGETAGNGTGLPAYYDPNILTPNWVDFSGNTIQV